MGFGYRAEFDSLGVDVSFLNFQFPNDNGLYASSGALAGSLLKLEGLYFTNPVANSTGYFGGGMSWGGTDFGTGQRSWHGSGLQGELTAGYEIGRATSVRAFVQLDAALPFYRTTSVTYVFPQRFTPGATPTAITDQRYAPSVAVSVGLGWQRGSKSRYR
jgi:hypothetical protein